MALVTHPDVDKVAFTGSTEIGKRIAKGVAGTDKGLTLELGGKAANIVFDDAPLDQAVEGIVNGIYFNQGEVCCAGSRLLAQESIVEPLIEKLKDRLSTIRVGDPLDKNTDVGAINSKSQLEKITELVASGVAEGAELYQPACDLPERGYFFRPTLFTNVAQSHRIAREEIFGPVLSVLTFRTPDEAVEKANNTVYGLSAGIWTDKGSRILEMAQRLQGRRRVGQHVQPVRPDLAVRWLQGIGLRARGRDARPARLRPARGPLMATRARKASTSPGRTGTTRAAAARAQNAAAAAAPARVEVRKTYKLYIGGAFPRTESGRSYVVAGGRRHAARQRLPGLAQGRARRGPGRARGVPRLGGQDRDEPRPGPVPRRRADGGPPRAVRQPRSRPPRGLRPAAARAVVDRAIDRWVWYAGWADKIAQVLGSSNPVAAPYFNFTIPEPTGVVGVVAPETSSLLGLVSRLAPPLVTGNAVVLLASERRPLPAVTLTEVLATSDVPGGVVNVLTGLKKELVPVLAAHDDVDALDTWGVADEMRTEVETLAADDIKRLLRRPTTVAEARFDWLDDAATERPEWIAAFLEMKTVWHPIGG